ncbi:MAG: NAD(P)-dependent oxidoreductase [Sporichthyaceae bacterium]|nr:NAD(P)-dependent oxidoreductase [Sporichthyaceae bacterium]
MTAVVTGAAGFVGRVLVERLLADGQRVVGIDRGIQRPLAGLTTIRADLVDQGARVRAALADADVVFHLAGCPGVRDPRPNIDELRHRDNVLATAAVLAAVPARSPLLVTSSSSVYGGASGGRASRETDPVQPRGGYARSKVAVEQLCRRRLAAGGRITVVRPFTVAGEGQRPDMALARWIAAAQAGRPLRIVGAAARTRDITDVQQVAAALIALAGSGADGPVNLGTGVGHSLARMVLAVARALDLDVRTELVPAGRAEVADTLADPARLRRLIGWVPVTDLDRVVARQLAASIAPAAELPVLVYA